jgi:hypothetical protein
LRTGCVWQHEIKRDAGFKSIRMHGLLTDDMGVYRVDARANTTTSSISTRSTINC